MIFAETDLDKLRYTEQEIRLALSLLDEPGNEAGSHL
jgi:hypothetical protein